MSLTEEFKGALGSWASGVSVVTAHVDGLHYGLTVSSFTSVSLEPPLILVCLTTANPLPDAVAAAGAFGVSILRREQEAASNHYATPARGPTRGFGEVPGEWASSDVPVVADALAYVVCQHRESLVRGDHVIVLGEVTEAVARDGAPLTYWRRAYRGVDPV